jgi:hypothetical protein
LTKFKEETPKKIKKIIEEITQNKPDEYLVKKLYHFYHNRKNKNMINWSLKKFIIWYLKNEKEGCSYCKCNNKDLFKFYKKTIKYNKRPTRGMSLEVDRRKSNKKYSEDNCFLACYWCNNAKTDVFKDKEFKEIGKAIGKTIKLILNNKK